jgi:hypothetical protein
LLLDLWLQQFKLWNNLKQPLQQHRPSVFPNSFDESSLKTLNIISFTPNLDSGSDLHLRESRRNLK